MQAVMLALLQGFTEFLPISSSAHLVLMPRLLGWEDQGLAFDVAVHVGTLIAVVVYFRHELTKMLRDWLQSLTGGEQTQEARLAWLVLLGTLPVAVTGFLLHTLVEGALRAPLVIATTTIVFGVLLGWADHRGRRVRDETTLRVSDVLIIGIAQAVALVPGTSRSGITMTAGMMLGLTRTAAARFSFLLSIPVIALAGGYEAVTLAELAEPVAWGMLLLGTGIAAISALLCIHLFLRLIEYTGMLPFVVYRLALGAFLFWMFL